MILIRSYFTTHVVHQNAAVVGMALAREQVQRQPNAVGSVAELHAALGPEISCVHSAVVRSVERYSDVHRARFACGRHLRGEFRRRCIVRRCDRDSVELKQAKHKFIHYQTNVEEARSAHAFRAQMIRFRE